MATETWNEEAWTRIDNAGAWLLGVIPVSSVLVPLETGGAVPETLQLFLRADSHPGLRITLDLAVVEGEIRLTGYRQQAPMDPNTPSGSWALTDLRSNDFVKMKSAWIEAAKEYVAVTGRAFLAPGSGPDSLGRRRRRGPAGPTEQQVAEVVALRDGGLSFQAIADQLPLSKATAARWYRHWKTTNTEGDEQT